MPTYTAEIYTVCHPDTMEIFYVGTTYNLQKRKYQHTLESTDTKVAIKIMELKSQGFCPVFIIIDSCHPDNQMEVELKWIMHYFNAGQPLLNRQVSKLTSDFHQPRMPIMINLRKDTIFGLCDAEKINEGIVKYIENLIEKDKL